MVQEGTINADSVSDIAIPDGVREAIGRRLNLDFRRGEWGVDHRCSRRSQLSDFETLRLLFEGDDREPGPASRPRLLPHACHRGRLDAPGQYQFTHAQIQETLLARDFVYPTHDVERRDSRSAWRQQVRGREPMSARRDLPATIRSRRSLRLSTPSQGNPVLGTRRRAIRCRGRVG